MTSKLIIVALVACIYGVQTSYADTTAAPTTTAPGSDPLGGVLPGGLGSIISTITGLAGGAGGLSGGLGDNPLSLVTGLLTTVLALLTSLLASVTGLSGAGLPLPLPNLGA